MKSTTNKNVNSQSGDKPKPETKLEFAGGVSRQMLSGVKRMTIRRGKRFYNRSINIHGYPAVVEEIRHTTLMHTDFTLLSQQGHRNMFNTLMTLQHFYPGITVNDVITIVTYRMLL